MEENGSLNEAVPHVMPVPIPMSQCAILIPQAPSIAKRVYLDVPLCIIRN